MTIGIEDFRIFSMTAVAIFMEAAPFLLLGSLVSGLFEEFVSGGFLERHVPPGSLKAIIFALGMGFIVPTCDCGALPITRRLLRKGFSPGAAFAYMLAAPVLNPVVLAATWTAFRGDLGMVVSRALVVALTAAVVGLILDRRRDILRPDAPDTGCACGCGHDHDHARPARVFFAMSPAQAELSQRAIASAAAAPARPVLTGRLRHALEHATEDFLETGKYLLLGALAASAFKTFIPGEAVAGFASSVWMSVTVMIVLAVLISICSTADSFIAASFTMFPKAAQLSFITLGPMFDLKLLVMYAATFRRRTFLILSLLPMALVWVICVALGLLWPGYFGGGHP